MRLLALLALPLLLPGQSPYQPPRMPDGKPDFTGIWQGPAIVDQDLEAAKIGGGSVIVDPLDGKIPYLPSARAQRTQNFQNRAQADPVGKCYMPGTPRLMYMPDPFFIAATPGFIAILSQFMHETRAIPIDGSPHLPNIDLWQGDPRGSWDGDTLVVDSTDFNDQTWFDAAGNYHSDQLHVVERFTRTGPGTIAYQATITDPKVFSKPWTIRLPLTLNPDPQAQILENECNSRQEGPTVTEGTRPDPHRAEHKEPVAAEMPLPPSPARPSGPNLRRMKDGSPNLSGYWTALTGGLYSIEKTDARRNIGVPAGKGIIVDPADGKLPYQAWAREKAIDLSENHAVEESDAHCYPSGIPHMMEAQQGFQILQPPGYVVMLWEYMHNYRIIPVDNRPHRLPASVHLFAGDSVGHWEGDTLVIDVTNQNARTWFDIAANFHSDRIHVIERLTPLDQNRIAYEATITDPVVYTRPWRIAFNLARNTTPNYRQMEFACWEGEHDLSRYSR